MLEITVPRAKGKKDTKVYLVQRLPSDPGVGSPAWRLTRADGSTCDVIITEHGPTCDCPDFNYNRGNQPKRCKHAAALIAAREVLK